MIEALIETYGTHQRAEGRSPATVRWHRGALGLFAAWLAADGHPADPERWTPALLRAYVVHLQEAPTPRGTPKAPHTVTSYVTSLRAFCHWLHREEFVAKDLVARVKVPKAPSLAKPVLSAEEVRRLLEAAKGTRTGLRDAALVLLALDTGLRCAELASLREDAVDWSAGIAKVMGKGNRERYVVFGPQTARALQRYRLKARKGDAPALFQGEEGEGLTTSGVYQACRRLGGRAGVALNPHKLRHSFVTISLRNGASPFLVQKQCGHRDLQTTLRYAHLATEDLVDAHARSSPVASVLKKLR